MLRLKKKSSVCVTGSEKLEGSASFSQKKSHLVALSADDTRKYTDDMPGDLS